MSRGRKRTPINTKPYVMGGMTQDECAQYITAESGQKLYLNIQSVRGRGTRLIKAGITDSDLYTSNGNRCYSLYHKHQLKLVRAYSCEGNYTGDWTPRKIAIALETKFHGFILDYIDCSVGNRTDFFYGKISAKRYGELGDYFWETIARPFIEQRLVK